MDALQLITEAIVDEAKSRTLADGRMLYNALIKSHSPTWGTFDGGLISDLEGCITAVLSRTPIEQKVAAFNQIALEEGIDPVTPDDFNLDFWIRDSFIDPSLVELIRQHKCSSNTSTSRARRKWRGRGGSGLGS